MDGPVVLRSLASAKVNLALAVTGVRADGYHELSSVFATIALADTVRVAVAPVLDVRITPDVGARPGDDLASRAVRAFAASPKCEHGDHFPRQSPSWLSAFFSALSQGGAVVPSLATR